MKNLFAFIFFVSIAATGYTQGAFASFIEYQRALTRPADALRRKEDTLQKQFISKGLVWPSKYIYIRSFKYDGELEVWVRNTTKEPFKFFKTYKVCALAGTLGPKTDAGRLPGAGRMAI